METFIALISLVCVAGEPHISENCSVRAEPFWVNSMETCEFILNNNLTEHYRTQGADVVEAYCVPFREPRITGEEG